ncbi:MAG: 4-oxalocrotonate tautomerase family protein [Pseudomonadota bacterium]
MPLVRITMAEGRSQDQKAALAREITDSLVRHCDAHAAHCYVIFDDVDPDDWLINGETITQRRVKRGEQPAPEINTQS